METFIMTDQPVTCTICGARAEIMVEFEMDNLLSQLCKCSNVDCHFIFIEQEDDLLKLIN